MASKMFKIGEYSRHGKWKVTVSEDEVRVEGMNWNTGEVMEGRVFQVTERLRRDLDDYLNQKMTSYWAEQLIEFVASVITVPEHSYVVMPW